MNILMITRFYFPHVGGVEKHVEKLANQLSDKEIKVTIITEKHRVNIPTKEKYNNLEIVRFTYPKIPLIGLIFIWLNLVKNIKYIFHADLIHIHDVFIWYLPLRFLFFFKPVYTTFHGWEGIYPIPKLNIIQKQVANKLSKGTIAVGDYISKYYKILPTLTIYGGVDIKPFPHKLINKNEIIYLGRLDEDTGILNFLDYLSKNPNLKNKIIFIGDGKYKQRCLKYGKVVGFANPNKYLSSAKVVFTSGYLSILESLIFKTKVYVYPSNKLKKDYYNMSPFNKIVNYLDIQTSDDEFQKINPNLLKKGFLLAEKYTWKNVFENYLRLWNILN